MLTRISAGVALCFALSSNAFAADPPRNWDDAKADGCITIEEDKYLIEMQGQLLYLGPAEAPNGAVVIFYAHPQYGPMYSPVTNGCVDGNVYPGVPAGASLPAAPALAPIDNTMSGKLPDGRTAA